MPPKGGTRRGRRSPCPGRPSDNCGRGQHLAVSSCDNESHVTRLSHPPIPDAYELLRENTLLLLFSASALWRWSGTQARSQTRTCVQTEKDSAPTEKKIFPRYRPSRQIILIKVSKIEHEYSVHQLTFFFLEPLYLFLQNTFF